MKRENGILTSDMHDGVLTRILTPSKLQLMHGDVLLVSILAILPTASLEQA